jgi:hypothetical protein
VYVKLSLKAKNKKTNKDNKNEMALFIFMCVEFARLPTGFE